MNAEYEKKLEAAIDRELKGLPELPAPAGLAWRVMVAIERQASLPWHRQAWQSWPPAARWASLALLMGLFGGLCYGGWELSRAEGFEAAMGRAGGWFSGVGAVWHVLDVLAGAGRLAFEQLSTGFIIACLAAMAAGYAMCVGLGTLCVRLAFARR